MEEIVKKILNLDMTTIQDQSPETLSEIYDLIKQVQGVIEVTKKEIGANLLTRFQGDGTIFGNYGVARVITPNFKGVKQELAEQFGAVKTTVDTTVLSKLLKKGTVIEGVTYTESIRVNSLSKSEDQEEVQ